MPQHETATGHLVQVIHSIKLGQKSGVLTVRRGEGGMQEEGTVVFVSGQMTQAAVGRRSGLAAFNQLCTWGYCFYTFLSSIPEEARLINPTPTFPADQFSRETDTFSASQHPQIPGAKPLTMEPKSLPAIMSPPSHAHEEKNGATARERPVENRIVPRSTRPLHDVLYLINLHQLSRSHRQFFLLIDGQRSLAEIMHLMRRNYYEIYSLLRDLEYLGVIEIGGN